MNSIIFSLEKKPMTPFFNQIRHKLANDNEFLKYSRYAIGEILLVVVGILIALQINNWNSHRLEEKNITNYYERIIVELDQETKMAMSTKIKLDSLIHKSKRALTIIDSKNTDSINVLQTLLGATATTWDVDYQFPITKEFVSQNYLSKIKKDTVKMYFEYLVSLFDNSERTRDYNSTQYISTIEPFFIKNINYSEVALPEYRKGLIQGGPKTNYEALFSNLELWNVITFKLELLTSESRTLDGAIKSFNLIKENLKKELEN